MFLFVCFLFASALESNLECHRNDAVASKHEIAFAISLLVLDMA